MLDTGLSISTFIVIVTNSISLHEKCPNMELFGQFSQSDTTLNFLKQTYSKELKHDNATNLIEKKQTALYNKTRRSKKKKA